MDSRLLREYQVTDRKNKLYFPVRYRYSAFDNVIVLTLSAFTQRF